MFIARGHDTDRAPTSQFDLGRGWPRLRGEYDVNAASTEDWDLRGNVLSTSGISTTSREHRQHHLEGTPLALAFAVLVDAEARIRSPLTAYRQRERERGAVAHLALHPDLPTVQLDEPPAEGKPKTGALYLLV